MLSTNAAAGVSDVRTAAGLMKRKSNSIIDYNKYMVGVDLSDRKIYHVSADWPTRRYWKKIFFNLLNMSLLNSHELYRANTDAARVLNIYEQKIRFIHTHAAQTTGGKPRTIFKQSVRCLLTHVGLYNKSHTRHINIIKVIIGNHDR